MSDGASTVVVRLDASLSRVRHNALCALGKLGPAALAQYADAIVMRVERLALYWYALPYRPNGPGHARDVEAWDRMTVNQDHQVSITTAATSRKRCKPDKSAGTQQNERQTRLRSRNTKSPRSE